MLAHPDRDEWWQDLSVIDRAEHVTVPALHIGGWFDIFVADTARSFTSCAPGPAAPRPARGSG